MIKLKLNKNIGNINNCLNAVTHGKFKGLRNQLQSELSANNGISVSEKSFSQLMAWSLTKSNGSAYKNAKPAIDNLCDELFGYHDFFDKYSSESLRVLDEQLNNSNTSAAAETELTRYHSSKVK
jgi:hypothetical protein